MPAPDEVIAGLTAIATGWQPVAIVWHLFLAALLAALLAGWQPTQQVLGSLLTMPIVSVSVLAWSAGNPFNGVTFAVLALVLGSAARRLASRRLDGAPALVGPAAVLIVFGWMYPHFLETDRWLSYAYAAPFGLVPCPTLAVVIGVTLIAGMHRCRRWSIGLIVAGLGYGFVGVFALGVALDYGLLAGATLLAGAVAADSTAWRSVRADPAERARRLAGDDLIPAPFAVLTHAVTIRRAPRDVWPWLVQMGAGSRAGWYSYDVLDNGGHRSATRIVPELQRIGVGTVFPAAPGANDGFTVLAIDQERSLVIGWPAPDGTPLVTWAFVLEPSGDRSTRLIVRVRGGAGYTFYGLPVALTKRIVPVVHFVMQRKQLLGIAARAEGHAVAAPA